MFARCPSPSPFRRLSSSSLFISAAIHSSAGFWKLAGSSSLPISKTRSMSAAPRLGRLGLLEQLGVPGQLLVRQRAVLEGGELHPDPRRQVQAGAIVRQPADPED